MALGKPRPAALKPGKRARVARPSSREPVAGKGLVVLKSERELFNSLAEKAEAKAQEKTREFEARLRSESAVDSGSGKKQRVLALKFSESRHGSARTDLLHGVPGGLLMLHPKGAETHKVYSFKDKGGKWKTVKVFWRRRRFGQDSLRTRFQVFRKLARKGAPIAAPLERFEHGDKEVWIQEYAGISLLDLLNASPEAGREAIIDVARRVGDSIRKHSRFSSYRVVDAAENSRNPSLSNLAYNPLTGEVKAVDALLKRKTAWRFAKDVISDN